MNSLYLYALFLGFLLSLSRAQSEDHFVTTTGRTVSKTLVKAIVPKALHAHVPNHLYTTASSPSIIHGPRSFRLNVDSLPETRTVTYHPSLTATIDGTPFTFRSHDTRILSDNVYSVVLRNGKILAVWKGSSMHLQPVPGTEGVFVDLKGLKRAHYGADNVQARSITPKAMKEQIKEGKLSTSAKGREIISQNATLSSRQVTSGACTQANRYMIEIAAAFDSTFCAQFGGDAYEAFAVVQSMFDESNVAFVRDTCVQLGLVSIEGYCDSTSDVFSFIGANLPVPNTGAASAILGRFASFYGAQRVKIHRDIGYFFSGFEDGTNTVGLAYTPGTCDVSDSYGWVENADWHTLAHEIGHNLNCQHTESGIMQASGDSDKFFSATSINVIKEFVDSGNSEFATSSSCLSPVGDALQCNSTCPNSACSSSGKCIVPVNPPPGFISCKRASTVYYCADYIDFGFGAEFNFYRNVSCQYDFVATAYDASDANVLCCVDAGARTTVKAATKEENSIGTYTFNGNPDPEAIFGEDGNLQQTVQDITLVDTVTSATCTGSVGETPSPSVAGTPSSTPPPSPSATSTSTATPTASVTPITSASPTAPSPTSSTSMIIESGTAIPTPSTTGSASSSPMLAGPTPSSSASVSAIPSPTNETPGEICGDKFSESNHLQCNRAARKFLRYQNTKQFVKVVFSVRNGKVYYKIVGQNGLRVKNIEIDIPTADDIHTRSFGKRTKRRVKGNFPTLIEDFRIRGSKQNCCGNSAAVAKVNVEVCQEFSTDCGSVFREISLRFTCGPTCKDGDSLMGIPMSESNRCPRCVPVYN